MYHIAAQVNTQRIATSCIVAHMDIHDRLRQARINAGFETASDAATRFGWVESTYRSHENGQRGIKANDANKYARAFRVTNEWLLLGLGEGQKKPVPLVGYVGAGAEVFPIDDGGSLDDIDPPPGVGPEAVAVRVRGDSMYPRYMDGDLLIYDKHIPLTRADGLECIVSLIDGRKFIKIVRAEGRVIATLESWNAPPIRSVQVEWAAPVVWVKRG
jgi:phage repressor protein C with HTH and peptisase S24 domain